MPRSRRYAPGGWVYHALNRGVGRMRLFETDADYEAFELILEETLPLHQMRLLAYSVMPNHWHTVVWPREDGDLSRFLHRLTTRHGRFWRKSRQSTGEGHVYQERFRGFPVETDEHLLSVLRYVERNALRANLVANAEDWRWGSLWRRQFGNEGEKGLLSPWPVEMPDRWRDWVNLPQSEDELRAIRKCIEKGRPFGDPSWVEEAAEQLGLQQSLKGRGPSGGKKRRT